MAGSGRAGRVPTRDDPHTMTGAYVLDAVSERERVVVERHLDACETCALDVAEFSETVTRLGMAATVAPPPGMRYAVLTAIRGTRQEPGRRHYRRRRGMHRQALPLTSAAACVLVAVTIALGVSLVQARDDRDNLGDRLAASAGILRADDVRIVRDDGMAVVFSHERDRAVVLTDLPPAPDGHDYQAWLVDDDIRSAGLIGPSNGVALLDVPHLDGVDRISVTIERSGGSPQPTTSPLVSTSLTPQ